MVGVTYSVLGTEPQRKMRSATARSKPVVTVPLYCYLPTRAASAGNSQETVPSPARQAHPADILQHKYVVRSVYSKELGSINIPALGRFVGVLFQQFLMLYR
jgi:hypothetical protein